MIILTSLDQFKSAAKRAKELKPRVWFNEFGTYFVEGQAQDYKVVFSKINGHFCGECNCKAHKNNLVCYHLAASIVAHKLQIGIRRQVRAAQVPSIADWIVGMEAA